MNSVRHQLINSGMRCQQRVLALGAWPTAGAKGEGEVGGTG